MNTVILQDKLRLKRNMNLIKIEQNLRKNKR